MTTESEIFEASVIDVIRYAFDGDDKDKSKDNKMIFALLCILLLVGAESIKVLFRKNIGKSGIDIPMLIGAILCFAGLSYYFLNQFYNPDNFDDADGSIDSYFVSGYLFAILAILTSSMGIYHYTKAAKRNDFSSYGGESNVLGFLKKEWKKDIYIQMIAEPLFVLSIGAGFCFYNLFAGIALIFCALSVWGRIIVSRYFLGSNAQRDIQSKSSNNFSNKRADSAY